MILLLLPAPAVMAISQPAARPESPVRLLVVDFGSYPQDCRQALESLGFEVAAFLPPSKVLLRAPSHMDRLSSLPAPAVIHPLQPQEKLSSGLEAYLDIGRPVTLLYQGPRRVVEADLLGMGFSPVAWSEGGLRVRSGLSGLALLASLPEVYWIEPAPDPVPANDHAARLLGARQRSDGSYQNDGSGLWSYNADTAAFEGLTGAGVNVSIADTGIDGTHPAFNGRKVAFFNYAGTGNWIDQGGSASGHGTMCAGIVAGDGSWRAGEPGQAGKYVGMAPGAGLIGQSIFAVWPSEDRLIRDASRAGAQVHSNSWSYGGYDGQYLSASAEFDRLVRDADSGASGDQPITIVFAAANSGPNSMTVEPPATAKNVITAGAIGNDRGGSAYGYVSSGTLMDFSSRGPCEDGRIKPDLVAPGIDTYTTSAQYSVFKSPMYDYLGRVPDDTDSSSYFAGGGTSAATPYIAGACALVIAHWRQQYGADPSPALVKALLINGAEPLPAYKYPGNEQGWGRVNVSRSLLPGQGRSLITVDQTVPLQTGESSPLYLSVSAGGPLKVSLVWTDVPGTPGAAAALINDLDLVARDPDGNFYHGNNFASGVSVAGGNPDSANNVEGLLLPSPKAGRWSVSVAGSDVPEGPQDYALVITGPVKVITADPAAMAVSASPLAPLEGEPVALNFTVQNMGTGKASGFPYKVTADGTSFAEGLLPELAAGETSFINAQWTAVRGLHNLSFRLNPDRSVDELDESNDLVWTEVTVLHYGVHVEAGPDSRLVDPGGTVSFNGTVTNTGTAPDRIALGFVSGTQGWAAALEPAEVRLEPNGTAAVVLNVSCPAEALAGDSASLTFTAGSMGNSTYNSSTSVKAVARQIYSVSLSSPPARELYPWEVAEFNITVTNGGNGDDTMLLAVEGETGEWEVGLSNSSIGLGARSSSTVTARVRPPPESWAGNSTAITVRGSSLGNVSATTALEAKVRQFFDIGLSFVLLNASCRPGGSAEALYRVRNLGNGQDDIELGLTAPQGWQGAFNRTLRLPPYGKGGETISVAVPPEALAGEYALHFYARSAGGPVRFANFSLRVEQVFSVQASSVPQRQSVYPGEPVYILVTLTNTGNGIDSYDVQAEGLPFPGVATGPSAPLELLPGASSSAYFAVSGLVAPGGSELVFRATSRLDPSAFNYSVAGLQVLAVPQPPPAPPSRVQFAAHPSVGGDGELWVALLLLSTVMTMALIARRWRALARARAPPVPPARYLQMPPRPRMRNA